MPWLDPLRRLPFILGLSRRPDPKAATRLAAAVVVFDREDLSMPCISVAEEDLILDRLRIAIERRAQGKFDAAEWSAEEIQWYFFGENVGRLEAVLLDALRAEEGCKGAVLRVSRNGIAGPWRETRI